VDFHNTQLSDVVLFELPAGTEALFVSALRARWPGWQHLDGEVALVAAILQPDEHDLALLLRYTQAVLQQLNLDVVRLYVDDRAYNLPAHDQGRSPMRQLRPPPLRRP
jgi:hypothetical protein